MNPLDLTTQRVSALHIQHLEAEVQRLMPLEAEVQRLMVMLDEAQKRIAVLDENKDAADQPAVD